jgi:O-antigen/teichoic acid export membrane protein
VKANLAANFGSLAYSMISAIVVMPFYIRLLGPEAFGLIGFYTLLSVSFQVFDFGLSLTFTRECARFRGGAVDARTLLRLFGALERAYFLLALTGVLVITAAAQVISTRWLRAESLSPTQIVESVALMGLAVPFQWVCGFYRGALTGLERQIWLAVFNVVAATARYFGAIAFIVLFDANATSYFGYQVALTAIELLVLTRVSRATLPALPVRPGVAGWREVRGVLTFSSGVAFASLCWITLTQADRLILSKVLALSDYGVFSLAVAASGALAMLGGPMAQALLPRLSKLVAEGEQAAAIDLYRSATQLACLIAFPLALVLACFADRVIWVWTGDIEITRQASPILTAYAVGSGLISLAAFPYYMQYSAGNLRLHVWGQGVLVAILLPILLLVAPRFGGVGTGVAWTTVVTGYLLIWPPVVHRQFAPQLQWRWVMQDIAPIAAATAATALILARVLSPPHSRLAGLAELVAVASAILGAGVAASPEARGAVTRILSSSQRAER